MKQNKWKKFLLILSTIITYIYPTVALAIGAYLLITNPMLEQFNVYIISILTLLLLLVVISLTLAIKKKSVKRQIITIVLGILLGIGITACDVLYYDVIQTMNEMTTIEGDKVTSTLYVKKDANISSLEDLKFKNIAVQPTNSLSMYTLLVEGIEAAELQLDDFTLSQYTNYINAYEDFLNDEVNAILLDESALSIIKEVYPEFDEDVAVVTEFSKIVEAEEIKKIDVSKEPFTMLISGIDARTTDLNAYSRSDVIMIAAFNPETLKLSLTSVPRDTYLPVTCRGFSDKITHSGTGGIQCTETSLEDAFDIEIDYYVKINFTAVVDIVDALGGIDVDVPFSFTESNSYDVPHTVALEKGFHTIDGEQALALCRHRNTLPRGDIDRGLNQQIVLEGLLRKVASTSSVLNVDKLLAVLGTNIQTNMPTEQMYGLFSLLSNLATTSKFGDISALNIQTHTIDGAGNMHTPGYTNLKLYFYMPYEYSMKNTTRNIRRILGEIEYPTPTNTFAFNANVPFDEISSSSTNYMDNDVGSTSYAIPDYIDYTIEPPTMPNLYGMTMAEIQSWANELLLPGERKLIPYFIYEDGTPATDSSHQCIGTSISEGTLLDEDFLDENGEGITITLSKPAPIQPEEPEQTPPENPEQGGEQPPPSQDPVPEDPNIDNTDPDPLPDDGNSEKTPPEGDVSQSETDLQI